MADRSKVRHSGFSVSYWSRVMKGDDGSSSKKVCSNSIG